MIPGLVHLWQLFVQHELWNPELQLVLTEYRLGVP